MNNDFEYFVSITFDDRKIKKKNLVRTDYLELKKKFLKSLNHYNRDNDTKLQYIITPEIQDANGLDGLHFHCLMNGLNDLKFVGRDKKRGYVMWRSEYLFKRFGANTVIKIYDYNKFVAYYISKYVTKQDYRIFNRRYFVSKGLKKSIKLYEGAYVDLFDMDDSSVLNDLISSYQKSYTNSMVEVYDLSFEQLEKLVNKDKNKKTELPF